MSLILRPIQAGDHAYIVDTWCRTYHAHATVYLGWIRCQDFVDQYRPTVMRLMKAGFVRVLCCDDDESTIVAWACVRENLLHYIHVREDWRGEGHARKLLEDLRASPMRYTHETDYWRKLAPRFTGWRFDSRPIREQR